MGGPYWETLVVKQISLKSHRTRLSKELLSQTQEIKWISFNFSTHVLLLVVELVDYTKKWTNVILERTSLNQIPTHLFVVGLLLAIFVGSLGCR